MNEIFPKMATIVPEGEKGEAKVVHFTVDSMGSAKSSVRAVQHGMGEFVSEGQYTRLMVDGKLMMSAKT